MKVFKKIMLVIGLLLVTILLMVGILLLFLTITEYKPAAEEKIDVSNNQTQVLSINQEYTLVSWNIGYAALGDNADFFMDGGKGVYSSSKDRVQENLKTIIQQLKDLNSDFIFLQEADVKSTRSRKVKEVEQLQQEFTAYANTFTYNYKVGFIPYPIPPLGHVESGLLTLSKYQVTEAKRIQLPNPFSWPLRLANLKRCLSVNYLPIEGTDKYLVLINLHLEAYDDGEGKIAQSNFLKEVLQAEYAKGNYVIASGDFNQIFTSADLDKFPFQEGLWHPGVLDVSDYTDFQCLMDNNTPSCRSLDQALEGKNKDTFQYYLIDGAIVSNNITIEDFHGIDLGFVNSDHNPQYLRFVLK